MKTNHLFPALSAAILTLGTALAGGEGWTSNFEAAKKQAAAEHKNLLIDFTGSDWCIWCKKLDQEVFSHDEFKNGVKDKFVLVELDFPRDKEKAGVTEEIAAQNEELSKKYAIEGYPTIMLCDASGKPFAHTGYAEGGPEKYVASLNELNAKKEARDKAFATAEKASGVEKAKALVSALDAMELPDESVASFYGDVSEQIKSADPKDETGFTKKQQTKQKFADFEEKLQGFGASRDTEGALGLVDETLKDADFTTEQKQQISSIKIQIFASTGKFEEAMKAVDETQKIDPSSEMSKRIEEFKPKLQQMKEHAASSKDKE